MSYQVIARKFRPQSFAEVTGQEHVTQTLANAIKRNKIGHAYLFTGLRGVGKTSIARIFAKSLNCVNGPTAAPCLTCDNCRGITDGSSIAVREIDGASHNSVDNVRDLIESFRTLPPPGSRFKIYIIDEVHMLSTAAFNALLKTLEEPPEYAIFMLATTEVHKIPETILSRCQRHDLRALTQDEVVARLGEISQSEGISIDQASLRLIARLSEGSMRDAQTMLERVQSFAEGAVDIGQTSKVLGIVERTVLFRLSRSIFEHKPSEVLLEIQQAFSRGVDAAVFLREFAAHWRELLLAKVADANLLLSLGVAEADRVELVSQVQGVSTTDVQELARISREESDRALRSAQPRYALEALVVRMALRVPTEDLATIIAEFRGRGEKSVAVPARSSSVTAPPPAPVSASSGAETKVIVPPTRSPVVPAAAGPSSSTTPFAWEDLVRFTSEQAGTRLLVEQLRRVTCHVASPGALELKGPEFPIGYLSKPENQQKVQGLLQARYPGQSWKLRLTPVAEATLAVEGSIVQRETVAAEGRRKKKEQDMAEHPAVKTVQKIFPGSTIEAINFKEPKE